MTPAEARERVAEQLWDLRHVVSPDPTARAETELRLVLERAVLYLETQRQQDGHQWLEMLGSAITHVCTGREVVKKALALLDTVHDGKCPRHWYHSRERELGGLPAGECECGVDAWRADAAGFMAKTAILAQEIG